MSRVVPSRMSIPPVGHPSRQTPRGGSMPHARDTALDAVAGRTRPIAREVLDAHAVVARVLSLLFWAFMAVSSLLLFPVAVLLWAVTAPFDRRLRVLHQFTCFWASLYT